MTEPTHRFAFVDGDDDWGLKMDESLRQHIGGQMRQWLGYLLMKIAFWLLEPYWVTYKGVSDKL